MTSSFYDPIPTHASRAAIEEAAEKARAHVNLRNNYDLSDLVKANSGVIEKIDPIEPDQLVGAIMRPDGTFTIRLSEMMPEVRNHFVIAKELGHLVLHYPKVQKIDPDGIMRVARIAEDASEDVRRCFQEAKIFAMSFLMPEAEFVEAYRQGEAHIRFAVTKQLAERRKTDILKHNPNVCPEDFEAPKLTDFQAQDILERQPDAPSDPEASESPSL